MSFYKHSMDLPYFESAQLDYNRFFSLFNNLVLPQ